MLLLPGSEHPQTKREKNAGTANSVKGLTVLDVVESTSLQVGLLVAGLLIPLGATRTWLGLDPYRLFLILGAGGITAGLVSLKVSDPDTRA